MREMKNAKSRYSRTVGVLLHADNCITGKDLNKRDLDKCTWVHARDEKCDIML